MYVPDKKEKEVVTGLKLEKQLALYPSSMAHGSFCLSPVLPHHPLLPSLGLFISPTKFNVIAMLMCIRARSCDRARTHTQYTSVHYRLGFAYEGYIFSFSF